MAAPPAAPAAPCRTGTSGGCHP